MRRHGFTLIELIIAIGLGLVLVHTAYSGFRVASQSVTTAQRLSLENGLIRAGYWAAVDEADFWEGYDDPTDPARQRLRGFDPANQHGLPFTPLAAHFPAPLRAPGATADSDDLVLADDTAAWPGAWDSQYQWPASDSRTWFHGNLAECLDKTIRKFGHYELFAHRRGSISLDRDAGTWPNWPNSVKYGAATPRHLWYFHQLDAIKQTLGYYAAFDYMPANAIFGVLGDNGNDRIYGTADDDPQILSWEWCLPSGNGGGNPWQVANDDGATRWPRGIFRLCRDTSFAVLPASRWTGARTDLWDVPTLVAEHNRSWATSRVASTTDPVRGIPDFERKAVLERPVSERSPAHWPGVTVSTSRYLNYCRFTTLTRIRWRSAQTGELSELSFSLACTTLRGARMQRRRDIGWAKAGDPTLDSP